MICWQVRDEHVVLGWAKDDEKSHVVGQFRGQKVEKSRWAPWHHQKTHKFSDGDIVPNEKYDP